MKHDMTRIVDSGAIETLKAAGWRVKNQPEINNQPEVKELAGEEIIRLKPAVKSKATVTAVEEANITNKGDE